MSAEAISGWARKFVVASAGFLVLWQIGELGGITRRTGVTLGVFGFVLHMIFGKGYSLIPTYFNRELKATWVPPVHLCCTVPGTIGLALATSLPPGVIALAAASWTAGVGLFLGAILWTIRGNVTGAETATSEANAHRRPVDRLANAFVPVALAYLALGSFGTLAVYTPLPGLFDGYFPRISHLLGAGTGAMLVFAIGFRLLPRFLAATPPRALVGVVLTTGAAGPIILASTLAAGWAFRIGAILEGIAVLGFAFGYVALFRRSERSRVGFYGVLLGALSGSVAILLGLWFAFNGGTPGLIRAHFRLNVLGFLGLTIVGIAYQFYPPAIGSFRGASDRTALGSIIALGGGVFLETIGFMMGVRLFVHLGRASTLVGALVYAGLIGGLFYDRYH